MEIIRRTRAARTSLHTLTAEDRSRLLLAMADSLRQHTEDILRINTQDIDCLLYTSPSPRDSSKSRMPSSA